LPAIAAAAQFAQATAFFCPEFGLPESSQAIWSPLVTKVSDRCGIEPDAFTLAAYDALKVFARVVEQDNTILNRKNDLTSSFTTLSNAYTGATGTISLNASGDRANGSFNYWGITSDGGSYQWTFVGQSE
jgi:ABC-type branched-subunit amino acid transport system substrate-binding protein